MRRTPTTRFRLSVMALSVLMGLGGAACSEKAPPPPPPVVKKIVPKDVAKAAEAPPAAVAAAKPPVDDRYNPKGKRDPFEPFIKLDQKPSETDLAAVPPLQRYDLAELKFVGIIWTARGARALIEDVNGKGYTVTVGTKIGRAGGVVTRITDGQLFVGEQSREPTGARVVREISLKLQNAGGQR